MTGPAIEKTHAGFKVDGLELIRKNCGCGGLTGPGGYGIGDCCQTYSLVRKDNNHISYFAKGTTPNTKNNYEWGYRVKKGKVVVDVLVYDTRNPKEFTFGGEYPPKVADWQAKGWQVVSQIEETLEDTGVPLPTWCQSAESCERPDPMLMTSKVPEY
jgi:hypothetical protein